MGNKKQNEPKYDFDHSELDKADYFLLLAEKISCEEILKVIDSGVNPGLAIFHGGKLKKINNILKEKDSLEK